MNKPSEPGWYLCNDSEVKYWNGRYLASHHFPDVEVSRGERWEGEELDEFTNFRRLVVAEEHEDTKRLNAIEDRTLVDHIDFMGTTTHYWNVHGKYSDETTAGGMSLREAIDRAITPASKWPPGPQRSPASVRQIQAQTEQVRREME